MKPRKLAQVARLRLQAQQLLTSAHVATCRCCNDELTLILQEADSPCAPAALQRIARRVAGLMNRSDVTPG